MAERGAGLSRGQYESTWYVLLACAMLCYARLGYAMLCYAMLIDAVISFLEHCFIFVTVLKKIKPTLSNLVGRIPDTWGDHGGPSQEGSVPCHYRIRWNILH